MSDTHLHDAAAAGEPAGPVDRALLQPGAVSIREAVTPQVRRLLVGVGLSALGGGLVLSLIVVYLHQVRGISLATAGLVLAWQSIVGFVAGPLFGWVTDRVGPRRVLLAACCVEAVGVALFAFVTTPAQAFAVATVVAVGGAGTWPPHSALMAQLSTPEHRQRVFGLWFMLLNLGLGIGGLIGASILDVNRPATFQVLYCISAASFLGYFLAVLSLRGYGGRVAQPEHEEEGRGGYREVLADRRLRMFAAGAVLLLCCGYGSMEAGIPAFITVVVGLPVNLVGVVFFFNTAVIVLGQVWVLKRVEGRSRARLLTLVGLLWASCWALLAVAAGLPKPLAAVTIALGVSVFAMGETLWSPVAPALVNDLAPDHLRGRYNAVSALMWSVSSTIGPLVAGLVIGAGAGVAWALGLAVGAVLAGLLLGRLRTVLTPAQDGRVRG